MNPTPQEEPGFSKILINIFSFYEKEYTYFI